MNLYQNELLEKINQLHADLDGFNGLEYMDVCSEQINTAIDEYNNFHQAEQSVHNDFDFTINKKDYLSLMREKIVSTNFQYNIDRLLSFENLVFPNLSENLFLTFESEIIKLKEGNVLNEVKLITFCADISLKQVIFRFTYYGKSHPDLEETPGYLHWLKDNIIKESNELSNLEDEYPNFDEDLSTMIGINLVYDTWIFPLLVNHLKLALIKTFQTPTMKLILNKYNLIDNVEIFMIEDEMPVIRLN
jgi:hypothetical protein